MNIPKWTVTSDIKRLVCYMSLLCSMVIADNFSNNAYAQTKQTLTPQEIYINEEKIINDTIQKTILKATKFPIIITYPNEKTLIAKWHNLLIRIGFNVDKQALALGHANWSFQYLHFDPELPHTTKDWDVVEWLTINSIAYDPVMRKFALKAKCKRKWKNLLRGIVGHITTGENQIIYLKPARIWAMLEKGNHFVEEFFINEELTDILKVTMSRGNE